MKHQSALHKFLFNLYGYCFFNWLNFLYPIYALFFVENGVPDESVPLLFVIWSLATMAAQVPVNMLSSFFRPKSLVIFGQFMKLSAFALWFLWPTFEGFAAGFMLWGIQWAIADSVFEGIVYDELKALRRKRIYAKISGRMSLFANTSIIISTAGSLMLAFGYGFVTSMSILSMLVSILFLMRMKTIRASKHTAGARFAKTINLSIRILRSSPAVLKMFVLTCILGAVWCMDDYTGLIGAEMGVPTMYVGGLYFMIRVFNNIGCTFAYKLEHVKDRVLFAAIAVMGLVIGAMYLWFTLPMVWLLGLFFLMVGALYTLCWARFQHGISSNCRTMMLGLNSAMCQVACIGFYALVAMGLQMGGYNYSVLLTGVLCVITGLWAILFLRPEKGVATIDGCKVCT